MDNQVPKYVTRERAAFLLGIPEGELGRISNESNSAKRSALGIRKKRFSHTKS